MFVYPRVWTGRAASMAARYRHLLSAFNGVEPDESTQQRLIQCLGDSGQEPDLGEAADAADSIVVGAGPPEAVKLAIKIAEKYRDKAVISWHDPLMPEHRQLEQKAAQAAKRHLCPTKPHRDLLKSLGAESVACCTPLLDDHEIPVLDRREKWDVCHFGWVGRNARDLPGLVRGVASARRGDAPWRVIQFGPLPKGMAIQLLKYRLQGAFSIEGETPQSDAPAVYSRMRAAAVLQLGGYLGEMCIPGKLIETVLNGCPPVCDRRGKLLAAVCDEAGLPSWTTPTDAVGVLELIDSFVGKEFARRLGSAIADMGCVEAFNALCG